MFSTPPPPPSAPAAAQPEAVVPSRAPTPPPRPAPPPLNLPTLPPHHLQGGAPPPPSPATSLVAPLDTPTPARPSALTPLPGRLPPLPGATRTPIAPSTPQPGAVLPGSAAPKRAVPKVHEPPTHVIRTGDLICGECGEGNDPVRKFCSRCGTTLAQAETMRPPPWHKRLFARSKQDTPADGERPGGGRRRRPMNLQRVMGLLRNLSFVVMFVAVGIYGLLPGVRNPLNDDAVRAKSWVVGLVSPTYNPVHAIRATASSEVPDHGAGLAIDNFKKSYWAADTKTDPQPGLTLDFDQPANIDYLVFTSGNNAAFESVGRPQQCHIVFFSRNAAGQTLAVSQDITLADRPDAQDVTVDGAQQVTRIEIHITSVFRAPNSSQVAVAEVEMFTKG